MLSNHNEMKLDINNRKKFEKLTKMLKLTHSLITNVSKKKLWGNFKNTLNKMIILLMNKNKDTTFQNLRNAAKAILTSKLIVVNA